MSTTLDRRERRHQRSREEILEAAWVLAERDGIASLSLRDLGERVGMRAPSLYTYFAGKDAIYDAMFAQSYRRMTALQERSLEQSIGMSRADALEHHLRRWIEFCQASVPRYQLMFTNAVPDWQPSDEAYEVSRQSYAHMTSLLAAHGVRGQRSLDLFTALGAGLAAQQLANDPGGDRWARLVPEAIAMFLTHHDQEESP